MGFLRATATRWLLAFAAWVLVVHPRVAAAAPPDTAPPDTAPPDTVTADIAAGAELAAKVVEVLEERLTPLGLTVASQRSDAIDVDAALKPVPDAAPVVARVWIDLHDAGEARLYLTDTAWERVLVRVFDRKTRSDEVLREELALIVLTAVETLREGATVGAPRDEVRADLGLAVVKPPEPEPEPAPPPPPASPDPLPPPLPIVEPKPAPLPAEDPWRLGGALVYEAQGYAEQQVLVHGPGLSLSVDTPALSLAPGGMLDVQYRIPYEEQGDEAGFRLQSLAMRLQAHLHVLRHPAVALRVHGGIAGEILFLEPFLVQAGEATLAPSRTRVAPIARVGLLAQLHLFGDTSLRLGFSGDVDIIGTRYVIAKGDTLVPLVEPLRIRPSLTVGIATSLLGGRLFPPARDPFAP